MSQTTVRGIGAMLAFFSASKRRKPAEAGVGDVEGVGGVEGMDDPDGDASSEGGHENSASRASTPPPGDDTPLEDYRDRSLSYTPIRIHPAPVPPSRASLTLHLQKARRVGHPRCFVAPQETALYPERSNSGSNTSANRVENGVQTVPPSPSYRASLNIKPTLWQQVVQLVLKEKDWLPAPDKASLIDLFQRDNWLWTLT
ncbi:hypothetical protein BD779DRAFT_116163 [Infundibulicybe gibba]|nr:hypothetical protein BD779DRAFT_116163 [Infundibulicybe gibba]